MKYGKRKRHRKIKRFYTACFGFREPFKVLCDGTFIHHLLLHNIMPADTSISKTLRAPVKLFTTKCVLAELKSLGKSHYESFKAAQNLLIARCDHETTKAAEDCLKEIIGSGNHEHFFVATQDDKLRKNFLKVPAVPLMYGLRNALFLEKPSAFQRQFAKSSEEERSQMSQSEYKMLMVNQKSGNEDEDDQTELTDVGGNEDDQTFGTHVMAKASSGRKRPDAGGVQFKRKRAKGPNPLSCKKKKDHMHINLGSKKERASNEGETAETLRSRKRKRSRNSQAAD